MTSSICFDRAAQYFAEFEALVDEDDGRLWGVNLYAPFILACPETRDAVANQPDPQGYLVRQGMVYAGTLPDNVPISNSVVEFSGQRWAIARWSEMESADQVERLRLMSHEAFHWWQPALFGRTIGWNTMHIDDVTEARILIQLEINALLEALGRTGEDRMDAIRDALSIRAERRLRFGGGHDENKVEIVEGTAQYTDMMLNLHDSAALRGVVGTKASWLIGTERISHMFSYLSGSMYCLLLDETGAPWRDNVRYDTNLGRMLQDAIGITEQKPFSNIDLELYGYEEIHADALALAETRDRRIQDIINVFASQPTIRIYHYDAMGGEISSDINMVSLPGWGLTNMGRVYMTGHYGRFIMREGFFLTHQNGFYLISAPDIRINGNLIAGHDWELELNEGFEISQVSENFIVQRKQ
jgi:hypothetical protein